MYSYAGSRGIVQGDKFVVGDPNYPIFGYYAAEVKAIDEAKLTATVALHQRPAKPVPVPEWQAGQIPPIPAPEGAALRMRGALIEIPAHDASLELVEQVARYLKIEVPENGVATALKARREALEAIILVATELYSEASEISEPPPRLSAEGSPKLGKIA
jgi:hypothetical protein